MRDTVAISVPYELRSLDPHDEDTASSFALLGHIYEPLVRTDASMKIVPALARTWETPDATTWIFRIREGVTFADGRPLEAADAAWSIHRLKTADGLEVRGYAVHIVSAEALDASTLRVRTARPLSILLNKLAFVHVVPRGSGAELMERANGTGPFVLAERTAERMRFVRRDDYWGEKPRIREAVFHLGRSAEEAAGDLVDGRAQLAQCSSRAAEATVRAAGPFAVDRQTSLFVKYLGFNVSAESGADGRPNPFRDPRVREAIDLALDRGRLVDDLSQQAVPASQYVPSTIFGFDPSIGLPPPDLDRARAVLSRAGHPEGLRARLDARRMLADAAHAVAGQLGRIGIALDVDVLDDNTFFERARSGAVLAHVSRFGCPTGDASDLFDNAFHTVDASGGVGSTNYSGYSDPRVDQLIATSAGIETVAERRSALQEITRVVMKDRPWIPLYVDQEVFARDPGLEWRPRNDGYVLADEMAWSASAP